MKTTIFTRVGAVCLILILALNMMGGVAFAAEVNTEEVEAPTYGPAYKIPDEKTKVDIRLVLAVNVLLIGFVVYNLLAKKLKF